MSSFPPQQRAATIPGSTDELRVVAAELAGHAIDARSPGRSLGALVRWRHRERGWPKAICDQLLRLAFQELEELQAAADRPKAEDHSAPVAGEWLSVEETADRINRSADTIRRRLRTADGRRDYGWPWWDGHRWQIPSPAIDPARRAGYMAELPKEDPYPPPPFAES